MKRFCVPLFGFVKKLPLKKDTYLVSGFAAAMLPVNKLIGYEA
jgi:hypothetical protein